MSNYFVQPDECSRHTIFPGVDIATMAGEGMMISIVEMQPGAVVEKHQHPHEQVGLLLEGELDFWIGDDHRKVQPGEMWRIPGETPHHAKAGPEGAKAIDIFHPVRDDYR